MIKPVQRHPLAAYFAVAYLGAWLAWTPVILSRSFGLGVIDLPSIVAIGLILLGAITGPMLAGLLVISAQEGALGRQQLWRQIIRWRFNPIWYLVALLLPLATNLLADVISLAIAAPALAGPSLAAIPGNLTTLSRYVPAALTVIVGTLPEEIGWRGCAVPRLQGRLASLSGTLALGFAWACWHLPFLLWSDEWRGAGHPVLPYLTGYIPMTMALAVFETVLFNRTRGSLLATALLHAAFNTASTSASVLLFGQAGTTGPLPGAGIFYAMFVCTFVVLAILVALGTRGRLGYPAPTAQPAASEALYP